MDALATMTALIGLGILSFTVKSFAKTIDENTLEVSDFTAYITRIPYDTTAEQVNWKWVRGGNRRRCIRC